MKQILFFFCLLAFLILNACKSRQLNQAEADRSMKILNGNLVNLMSAGSEKPEFKALSFLLKQTSTPLPFVKRENPTQPDTVIFRLEERKGIYQWNQGEKIFYKLGNSEIISLYFPEEKSEANSLCFNLEKYQSQAYSSRPDFPTELEAILKMNDQKIASISHKAKISNNLPEHISTRINGTDYLAGLDLKRTQLNKEGTLLVDFFLKSKGFHVISGKLDAQIEYSKQGYFFKTINFRLKLIDHQIEGKINYSAINPTSSDYIDSFNSNSSILIFEDRNEVGNIVLNKTDNNELLDYFVRFSNGKEILLSEYIPALKKLLNLKY